MRTRTFILIALASAAGGTAAWAGVQALRHQTPILEASDPGSVLEVVVAARDLPVGTILGPGDVKALPWPGSAAPEGYARTVNEVVGRGVTQSVRLNEPLLDSRLSDRTGQGGLPIAITPGMRAVTVRVDDVVGVGGFIDRGTRVDVILTMTPTGTQADPVSRILLQNVEVAARNQQPERDPQGRPANVTLATLLVSPEDAERLTLAMTRGTIQLALRNMIDVQEVPTSGARMSRLFETEAASTPSAARTRRPLPVPKTEQSKTSVELYKGASRAVIVF